MRWRAELEPYVRRSMARQVEARPGRLRVVSRTSPGEVLRGAQSPALTHIDGAGRARMVDVTGKPSTRRRAVARCRVELDAATIAAVAAGAPPGPVGVAGSWAEVLGTARLAGIQAAKQTASLIPLCHPLTISNVDVRLSIQEDGVDIEGEAEVVAPTGVEMEALTACAIAALSVVASLQPIDSHASIEDLGLWEKSGGRSGTWLRR